MKWMSPTEAAQYVGCHIQRIYQAARSGELEAHVKPWAKKGDLVIAAEHLDEWIQSWPTPEGDA